MSTVTIENVSKTYALSKQRIFHAVEKANLTIESGEFMVLVGPSGCGKSTTLRMIAGLEEITDGNIYIDGKRINDVAPKDRDIAMVFQNYALYPHMTIYRNMAFGLELRKMPRADIAKRVKDAAQILGLNDDMLSRKPKALSGGQRQRVALGRAIVRDPKVFLFDEPLSNLDAKMRVQTRIEISRLHRQLGATMIYVTHDQVEAMTMGDRICLMKDGRIQQVDRPLHLYNNPANTFVAAFIGSPPMNFFPGTIQVKSSGLYFQGTKSAAYAEPVALPINDAQVEKIRSYAGREVILGVRPEDLHLDSDHSRALGNFPATLQAAEGMGAETFLYLATAGVSFIARAPGHLSAEIGTSIKIRPNMQKAHFFESLNRSPFTTEEGFDLEKWQVACRLIV